MTPLHDCGEFLRDLFATIPLGLVRGVFAAVPLLLLVWVWRLPESRTQSPDHPGWSGNLKVWANLTLLIQIVIYSLL